MGELQGRQERLAAIRRLVNEKHIATQEELTKELLKLGHEVVQATVSRDIGDLGLLKVKREHGSFYGLPEVERLRSMLKTFWSRIDWSDNLVVLKSAPGTAQGIAAAIDEVGWSGVVGTVGGDDTTLIIARNQDDREAIVKKLNVLYEE